MNYSQFINSTLRSSISGTPTVVDLFAGCGGLALGFEAQGFATLGFEANQDCVNTYRTNLGGTCINMMLDVDTALPEAKVLIGGPPCQPFSVGGNQLGESDSRNGLPIFVSAVKRLQPDIWLFENVRGVLYRNQQYFNEVLNSLRALNYLVEVKLLNAAQYGVPQKRERIIVVGHRGIFHYPQNTNIIVTAGEAIKDLKAPVSEAKFLTPSMDAYIEKYERNSRCVNPRDLILEQPSRTITCRNLSGATGDMMRLRLADGRRRQLTQEEAARLQSFPDHFKFCGSPTSRLSQIGNAVPPLFAYYLASSVRDYLESIKRFSIAEIQRHKCEDKAQCTDATEIHTARQATLNQIN